MTRVVSEIFQIANIKAKQASATAFIAEAKKKKLDTGSALSKLVAALAAGAATEELDVQKLLSEETAYVYACVYLYVFAF